MKKKKLLHCSPLLWYDAKRNKNFMICKTLLVASYSLSLINLKLVASDDAIIKISLNSIFLLSKLFSSLSLRTFFFVDLLWVSWTNSAIFSLSLTRSVIMIHTSCASNFFSICCLCVDISNYFCHNALLWNRERNINGQYFFFCW